GEMRYCATVVLAPTVNAPAGIAFSKLSSTLNSRYKWKISLAYRNKSSPSSVITTELLIRSKSRTSNNPSRFLICLVTAGCVINNSAAALVKLLLRATEWNTFNLKSSIFSYKLKKRQVPEIKIQV